MGTLTFYDAAWPPPHPPGTDGVCFYIGGDTPHVWTLTEIEAQKARYRLPVYVRSNPGSLAQAAADLAEAVSRLRAVSAPRGTLVAWDMETAAAPAYISAVYAGLAVAGWKLIVYGSESFVAGNDNPDGLYWGADWTDVPHLHSGDVMTQWVSFSGYDLDLAQASLPFWDVRPPQPPPPPAPNWTETLVNSLPALEQGATGPDVETLQGCLCARGHTVVIDGAFGPATGTALKAFQTAAGITADGITGPVTWPKLLNR